MTPCSCRPSSTTAEAERARDPFDLTVAGRLTARVDTSRSRSPRRAPAGDGDRERHARLVLGRWSVLRSVRRDRPRAPARGRGRGHRRRRGRVDAARSRAGRRRRGAAAGGARDRGRRRLGARLDRHDETLRRPRRRRGRRNAHQRRLGHPGRCRRRDRRRLGGDAPPGHARHHAAHPALRRRGGRGQRVPRRTGRSCRYLPLPIASACARW